LAGLLLGFLVGQPGYSQSPASVALSFDHVTRPAPSRKDIDSDLLWLRIKNNGHTAIQVLATAPQTGAQGVELVHEIVRTPAKSAPGWISPPEHYSPVNEAATIKIKPNDDLLFSVPLNHVGPSWLLRITFELLGSQREGTVDFSWADVPVKQRDAWKRKISERWLP
jgi:hypothetical protein